MSSPTPSSGAEGSRARPLRVALLTSTRERCGVAEYSRHLAAALRRLVSLDTIPVEPLPLDRSTISRINAADVVHLQHEYSFFGSALPGRSRLPAVLRAIERPCVITAHTVAPAEQVVGMETTAGWRRLAKWCLLRSRRLRRSIEVGPFLGAARIIVHSRHARERLIAAGLPSERVLYLPMPVPRLAPAPADETPPVPDERFMLTFGFLTPAKGMDEAVRALREYPGLLLVVGEARGDIGKATLAQLDAEARAAGVRDRVRYLAYVPDAVLDQLLRAAEIVALPYRSGTGSYALVRALACEAVVVGSDLALFDDYPFLPRFGRRAGRSLGEVARALADSPEQRAVIRQAARSYAAQHGWDEAARRHVEIYHAAATR